MAKQKYWGEIPDPIKIKTEKPDLTELIDLSRKPDCLDGFEISCRRNNVAHIQLQRMCPRMLYAGMMHDYIKKMTKAIECAKLAEEFKMTASLEIVDYSLPKPPADYKNPETLTPFQMLESRRNNFAKGIGPDVARVSDVTRRHYENQCVATMLRHIGFEFAKEDALNTLTDVLEEFMYKFCQQLRSAQDSCITGESPAFCDLLQQVLVQIGFDGIEGIHDYYKVRVINYEKRLHQQCIQLHKQYKKMMVPEELAVEIKRENMEDDEENGENIPEVHFTAVEGEGEYLQSFLESGFQMLNSLEQEDELNS